MTYYDISNNNIAAETSRTGLLPLRPGAQIYTHFLLRKKPKGETEMTLTPQHLLTPGRSRQKSCLEESSPVQGHQCF